MQRHDEAEPAVEVFFRFQVKDPETGQPYTVTISQEGVTREAEAGAAENFDCSYQSHINADLQVELLPNSSVRQHGPAGAQAAVQGHHDLRHLLQH